MRLGYPHYMTRDLSSEPTLEATQAVVQNLIFFLKGVCRPPFPQKKIKNERKKERERNREIEIENERNGKRKREKERERERMRERMKERERRGKKSERVKG